MRKKKQAPVDENALSREELNSIINAIRTRLLNLQYLLERYEEKRPDLYKTTLNEGRLLLSAFKKAFPEKENAIQSDIAQTFLDRD